MKSNFFSNIFEEFKRAKKRTYFFWFAMVVFWFFCFKEYRDPLFSPLIPDDMERSNLFKKYHHIFYFNDIGTYVSILASLFIPPFIQLYGFVKTENHLIREFIKFRYNATYIIKIVVLFALYVFTESSIFKLLVSLIISIELILIYFDYYKINFDKSRLASKTLINLFNEIHKNNLKFYEVSKKFKEQIKKGYSDELEKEFNNYSYFTFNSKGNPVKLNESAFLNFKLRLEECLAQNLQTRLRDEEKYGEYLAFSNLFILESTENLSRKQIYLSLRLSNKVDYEGVKDELSKLDKEFEKCFIYKSDQARNYQRYDNYFAKFPGHIYELLLKKDISNYNEEIELLKDFLLDNREIITGEFSLLIDMLYKMDIFYNEEYSEVLNSQYKLDLYTLIKRVFLVASNNGDKEFSFSLTKFLLKSQFNGFCSYKKLESDLTSIINYQSKKVEFFYGYIDGIVNVISTEKDKENIDTGLALLRNLSLDLRSKELYKFKDRKDEVHDIVRMLNTRILILCAQAIYDNWSFNEELYPLVSTDEFFQSVSDAYSDKYGEYSFYRHEEKDFDRFGVSAGWSFSPHSFYEKFIVEFFLWAHLKGKKIINDIGEERSATHLFKEAKKKILERNSEVDISGIDSLVENNKTGKDLVIIQDELDVNKMEQFVDDCKESYDKELKLSSILGTSIDSSLPVKPIGYNITIPREYFTVSYGTVVINQGEYGRGIARGENTSLIEKITSLVEPTSINVEDFFNSNVDDYFEKPEDYVFVTNMYSWDFKVFNWAGKCLFSDNVILERNHKERISYLRSVKNDKKIQLYQLSLDRKLSIGSLAMFIKKSDLVKVCYGQTHLKDSEFVFDHKKRFYVGFDDISKNDEEVQKMLNGKYFEDEELTNEEKIHHIQMHLGLQIQVNFELVLAEGVRAEDIFFPYLMSNIEDED